MDIPETLEDIHWEACGLECPVLVGGRCKGDFGQICTRYKFDSAAAEILFSWSLESLQDEECGHSEYGNGWNALFREERAFLNADSQGFVSARRVPESQDLDREWLLIEQNSVSPEDV